MDFRPLVPSLAITLCLLGPAGAAAADAGRGELLYENHCTVCHSSVVHLRERRIARTPAEVRAQVLRWSTHLKLEWGNSELDDVVQFLVNRHYRFGDDKKN